MTIDFSQQFAQKFLVPTVTDYIAATTALHLSLFDREKVPELTAGQVEFEALKRRVYYGGKWKKYRQQTLHVTRGATDCLC